jgi:dsDNA-binding SOS-regulon protein
MWLRRLRLRLWWLMSVIAAIGLLLGAYIEVPRLRKLVPIYRSRAKSHEWLEQQAVRQQNDESECLAFWSALATEREKQAQTLGAAKPDAIESWAELACQAREQALWHTKLVSSSKQAAEYHARMRQKWNRLSAYPWLSAEPDPPPP